MFTAQTKAINKLPSDWIIYEEMSRLYTTVTVKCCTLVSPVTIALFTGPSLSSEHVTQDPSAARDSERYLGDGRVQESESSDSETEETSGRKEKNSALFNVDEWIALSASQEVVNHVSYLHHKLQALFIRRIRSPSRPWSQVDEMVVRAVAAVLTAEEQAMNPSLHPRQRRTRPGFESGSDSRSPRPRSGEQFSPSRDRPRDSSGSSPRVKSEIPSSSLSGNKVSNDSWSPRASQQSEKSSEARYFIMKCNNQRNLDISMAKGIWATTLANEKKLNKAFKESKHVMLVFSVQGSGHFQGYAQMTSPIGKDKSPEFGSSSLSGVFSVEWMKKASIPFQQAHHLVNPWNDHKKVQISRDGQELEPKIGEELCMLWDADQSGGNGRTPRATNNTSRRGKPSGPAQSDPHAATGQWQGAQYTAMQQVYATHTPSMPIPVPIPSAHSRHTIAAPYPRPQVVAAQPMAVHPHPTVPFGAHAMALQSQFRPTAAPRFPGAVVQAPHIRTMGAPPRASRGSYHSPRK